MMKSAMIGAVAGFFAFLAAWVGWGYVTGKFDRTISPARVVMKPASAPSALPSNVRSWRTPRWTWRRGSPSQET